METLNLLSKLKELGIELWLEENKLKISAPDTLSPELQTKVREHEAQLIAAISVPHTETTAALDKKPNIHNSSLSAAERTLILDTWNQTEANFPAHACPFELIAEQAARTPQATAVISHNQTLTYGELISRANQLAHHLRRLGVGPETIVGISIGRVPDLIVGLLGILNAGGAYLPLDPDYPQDRLAFMIEDAQTPVLLTTEELAPKLPDSQATVVKIDTDWPTIAQQPTTLPDSGVTPDNLAYIIYTSGSTGKPKGVMIPHRAMMNHNWYVSQKYYGLQPAIQPTDRMLQFTTINFDVAVEEIFPTLLSGAALVLSATNMLTATDMNALIDQHQITLIQLPTAYWQLWVREMEQSGLPIPASLRAVAVGGEAMIPSLVSAWFRLEGNGRVTLINGYGPTETTVTATGYIVQPEDSAVSIIPIGRPIDNYTVYVLNGKHQPVPTGQPGELYIGGTSLARGYLRRPERTAQSFLPDPFANDPEARMYKTGDQVRWLPDGNLEFLGRTDFQVKVRGFRIELGEIETALQQAPGVHESLVLAQPDANGQNRLVAYLIGKPSADPTDLSAAALQTFLLQNLPEYMVPTAYTRLDAWPLTPNGKIDRRALPTNFEISSDREIVLPRNEIETALVNIWKNLLDLSQISVHDNFFELGGNSLMVTQLVSRLRDKFNVNLPLRLLFDAPTVAKMATIVESLQQLLLAQQTAAPTDDNPEFYATYEEGEL